MSVKINNLEIENVKRVKAVVIEPTQNGLTILGGNNNQGKTSVLDAIAWALGGNKYKPSNPHREGSVTPPNLRITMSNGLIVERKGKNSSLTVLDPQGNKGGQQLLNSFVEELAIDLPKFMESTSKEKANTLLQIIGIGEELIKLDMKEQEIYNERYQIGRIADQKKKFAEEQIHYPDAPSDLVSTMELIQQQQMILAINGENQRKRENAQRLQTQFDYEAQEIERVKNQLQEMIAKHEVTQNDLSIAKTSAQDLQDQSTAELEHSLQNVEQINLKVRANLDKEKAEQDAENYLNQYKELDEAIKAIREQRMKLLDNAELPLPGLSVKDGELTYNGQGWTDMSGSDQLKVSTAIVRKLKPECGFVLLDKLEQMDMITLNEFSKWLEQEGLQAIATRVSTGEECQIIIEDGYVIKDETAALTQQQAHADSFAPTTKTDTPVPPITPTWKGAAF